MIKLSTVLFFLISGLAFSKNNHREQNSIRFNEKPLPPVEGTMPIERKEEKVVLNYDTLLEGKALYKINCSICHGMDGSGDSLPVRRGLTKPKPLSERELDGKDFEYYEALIREGAPRMPAFKKKLTKSEREKVTHYVLALRLSRKIDINKLDAADREKLP